MYQEAQFRERDDNVIIFINPHNILYYVRDLIRQLAGALSHVLTDILAFSLLE